MDFQHHSVPCMAIKHDTVYSRVRYARTYPVMICFILQVSVSKMVLSAACILHLSDDRRSTNIRAASSDTVQYALITFSETYF
ncbi:hypothetical protein QTP88_012565 [Uroleucon formosanum]